MLDWYWIRGQLVEPCVVVWYGQRRKADWARLGLGKPRLTQRWAVPTEAMYGTGSARWSTAGEKPGLQRS